MFKRTEKIEIDTGYCLDFVKCLGEIGGFEFKFGDEFYYVDDLNPKRKTHFRRWLVTGTKTQIDKLYQRLEDRRVIYRHW